MQFFESPRFALQQLIFGQLTLALQSMGKISPDWFDRLVVDPNTIALFHYDQDRWFHIS